MNRMPTMIGGREHDAERFGRVAEHAAEERQPPRDEHRDEERAEHRDAAGVDDRLGVDVAVAAVAA